MGRSGICQPEARRIERRGSHQLTLWDALAMPDSQLEQRDLVELNFAIVSGVASLQTLEVRNYFCIVDKWTEQFKTQLPGMEQQFRRTPERWKGDIRFFRIGMLQGFLGHVIGLRYAEDRREAHAVRYTNPSDLFLNGLIDTKQGTCGNMPTLHVAMCRRMGWPVSLACAGPHLISRFDDGEVVYNIEATSTHPGNFCSEPDETYIERFQLPRRAIECGSDLRRLTAREMIAIFLSLRARHYADTGQWDHAEADCLLSRVLFPQHRRTYIAAMAATIQRGAKLFEPGELGHPDSLFSDFAPTNCVTIRSPDHGFIVSAL